VPLPRRSWALGEAGTLAGTALPMARGKSPAAIGGPAARVIASAIFACCFKDKSRAPASAVCADAGTIASAVEKTIAKVTRSVFVILVHPTASPCERTRRDIVPVYRPSHAVMARRFAPRAVAAPGTDRRTRAPEIG